MLEIRGLRSTTADDRIAQCEQQFLPYVSAHPETCDAIAHALATAGVARGMLTYADIAECIAAVRATAEDGLAGHRIQLHAGIMLERDVRVIDNFVCFLSVQSERLRVWWRTRWW
jgi:hypothetical protein